MQIQDIPNSASEYHFYYKKHTNLHTNLTTVYIELPRQSLIIIMNYSFPGESGNHRNKAAWRLGEYMRRIVSEFYLLVA